MEELKDSNNNKKFIYGMVAAMLCWGLSWPSGKVLSSYGPPESISFFRFLVTTISSFVLLFFLKDKIIIKRSGLPVLLAAGILMTTYGYLFIIGLQHGKPGAGGVLVTTLNPIITYAIVIILTRKLPSSKDIIGLLIGLCAGVVLLSLWQNWRNIIDANNLYFVSATFTWAILSRFTSISSRYGSPLSFSLWIYFICTIFMALISDMDENLIVLQKADSYFWMNLFFGATITTSLATTFYFYATTKIGYSKASTFIFIVPLAAAAGAWIFLGEVPLWNTMAGGVLGIVAVYVLNRKQ